MQNSTIKKLGALVALMATTLSASAQNFECDGIYYNILSAEEKTAEVTKKPNWYEGDIVIPSVCQFDGQEFQVVSIGDYAFDRCSVTSVTIPNTITNIGRAAFSNSSLTSITIPNAVTNIGEGAFNHCIALTGIQVESDNPNYCSSDGVLFNIDKSTLIAFPGGRIGEYQIPNSVTNIGDGAFIHSKLTSVTIPNSITRIGKRTFFDSKITSVNIPNSVTSIDEYAFVGCAYLTNIQVESGNPNYSSLDGALFNIDKSELIVFPCGKVGEYQIPNTVMSIGGQAFYGCFLTSVTIPNSVMSIGKQAFAYSGWLTSVTIPNSVTYIGEEAFYYSGMTSVVIPKSVTNIGNYAFSNCRILKSIYVEWEAPIKPQGDDYWFDTVTLSDATLYVPLGRVDAYKTVIPWKRFAHIEEYDPEMSRIDAVEQAAAQPAWHVEGGRLHIEGETVNISIFNAAGVNVYNGPSDRIPTLPHGLYIAKIGNTTAKLSL